MRLFALAMCLFAARPLSAQQNIEGFDEGPLLPTAISEQDVEMRGRFARQWKTQEGELVVLFTGGFRLDIGQRQLSADSAVVWIRPDKSDDDNRKFYQLIVYLSGHAEVRDLGGTQLEDEVLLVSNLRTFGRVVKYQDAHSPEPQIDSALYQRALLDRARIEGERGPDAAESGGIDRPAVARAPKRAPRVVRYQLPNIEPATTPGGEPVLVATGRVYFAQSGDSDSPMLEIQADCAVVFPAESAAASLLGEETGLSSPVPTTNPAAENSSASVDDGATGAGAQPPQRDAQTGPLPEDVLQKRIRAVYLEGDVVLSLGNRFVRASRLYYDFELSRALILDAVLRVDVPERSIPLYVRADEIRQLSAREFSAANAEVTTSEFFTPHYHVGAEKVYLRDRTDRLASGQPAGPLTGTYELRGATFNIERLPLSYWPYSRGNLEQSETLLRRFRTGYSDEFGGEFETAWYLFNLLGASAPPGFDATLRLDYFTQRGPAIGVNTDYAREDYFGLFRSYYINDGGEDNFGPYRDNIPDDANRGRVLWRHRHYLPNDWELTLETAYASDPGFLETYEKSEWFEGKDQETDIYLKRARGNEAITLLANWRTLDFVTQTEHLPDLTYRRIGDTLFDTLVSYSEGRVGMVRYRPDDRRYFDDNRYDNTGLTDATFRTDGRQEFELPLKAGALNVVPFSTFRGSYWDGQPLDEGSLWRGIGVYGVRGGTYFSRVYDQLQSELLDINRIRHIIRPEFAAWWAHSNTRSELITPFDEGIETIDDFYGGKFTLRQTWQTKRGSGSRQRTTDLFTMDLEIGAFGDQQPDELSSGYANFIRPEDSRTRNYIAGDMVYRISDTTSLLYDFNYDLSDGSFDRHNVSLAVERLPRTAYVFGYRRAGDIDMDLLGGGFNYKATEKHIFAYRNWFDLDRGEIGEISVSYIRKLPRWYVALTLEIDEVLDDSRISISVWPEGIPEWTLGSRRFSGVSGSTGIRP